MNRKDLPQDVAHCFMRASDTKHTIHNEFSFTFISVCSSWCCFFHESPAVFATKTVPDLLKCPRGTENSRRLPSNCVAGKAPATEAGATQRLEAQSQRGQKPGCSCMMKAEDGQQSK